MSLELPTITAAGVAGGIVGALVGALGTLVTARYTWRKDRRESDITASELKQVKEAADDRASDRLVKLLADANELAIKNERLQYEIKLNEEVEKLNARHKTEMDEMRGSLMADIDSRIQAAVDAALDKYGCEAAPDCDNHRPRKRPDASI